MRVLFLTFIVGLLALAGCGNQTAAQKQQTLVCLEDQTGAVLAVVAGQAVAGGKVTTQTVAAGAGTVLASAAADPNCAAAILAGAGAAVPPPVTAPAPPATPAPAAPTS